MIDPFKTRTHAQRTYRELKLLMYLNHPDAQVCIKQFSSSLQYPWYFFYYRLYNCTTCLHLTKVRANLKDCKFKKYFSQYILTVFF
jgi:hypothetical protein